MKLISTLLLLFSFFLSAKVGFSQVRIAIEGVHIDETSGMDNTLTQVMNRIPKDIITFLTSNKKFIVYDRQNSRIIEAEKELQKSEGFMDGYMVEQGKSEGVDYILKPYYFSGNKTLTLKVYEVSAGTVKCAHERVINSTFLGYVNTEAQSAMMMHEILYDCFDIKFPLVRNIKASKDKSNIVLVAMGKNNRAKEGLGLSFYRYSKEIVLGEEIKSIMEIGTGVISKVSDNNFSEVKIEKGNKEIFAALADKDEVYCKVIVK